MAWYGKTKPSTTKACNHQPNEKLKPGYSAFYDIWPGNGADLFSKKKISKGGDKYGKGKSAEKRTSGKAYNINKQKIYIVPKSKIESRAHYSPEPGRGQRNRIFLHKKSQVVLFNIKKN